MTIKKYLGILCLIFLVSCNSSKGYEMQFAYDDNNNDINEIHILRGYSHQEIYGYQELDYSSFNFISKDTYEFKGPYFMIHSYTKNIEKMGKNFIVNGSFTILYACYDANKIIDYEVIEVKVIQGFNKDDININSFIRANDYVYKLDGLTDFRLYETEEFIIYDLTSILFEKNIDDDIKKIEEKFPLNKYDYLKETVDYIERNIVNILEY